MSACDALLLAYLQRKHVDAAPRQQILLPCSICMQAYFLIFKRCLQTYVTNINAQVDKFPELKDLGLVTLNQSVGTSKVPKEANTAVR